MTEANIEAPKNVLPRFTQRAHAYRHLRGVLGDRGAVD
jgi:hypothetical protein